MVFFDHQLEDKFVELNKINLYERLNQVHRDLLDHNEMLFIRKFDFLTLLNKMNFLFLPAKTDA